MAVGHFADISPTPESYFQHGKVDPNVVCYKCGKQGHMQVNCQNKSSMMPTTSDVPGTSLALNSATRTATLSA